MATPQISFEFYPPRTSAGEEHLQSTWRELNSLNPELFSVTFGAGGSTREKTQDTIAAILKDSSTPAAPHISCIGSTKENISALLNNYLQLGVKNLVVLRGDIPSGMIGNPGEFNHASDLVKYIRQQTGNHFTIYVAAYPEMHPESPNPHHDIENLAKKVNEGANATITQYFYNLDAFLYFRDQCQQQNITVPIIPGIMPITNFQGLKRFSQNCGAEIPRWLYLRLEAFNDNENDIATFGLDVVTHLCENLLKHGVPGLHFYTLNKANASLMICKRLGLSNL